MAENEKDRVSIIVPVYNDEVYIRNCVDSILNQTYEELEIILVDDASTDASLKICRQYASKDSRIKVIHNEYNQGLSGSREIGYSQSTGEWISFMDHDDCINPRTIAYLMENADDAVDIVAARYKNILNSDFEKYTWEEWTKTEIVALSHDQAVNTLGAFGQYEVPECLWGKIYRKELFDRIEIRKYKKQFSLVYFEDVLLTSALIKACREMRILNQYIYIHRVDFNSVSMSPNALEFNLQTARTADIVITRVNEPYSVDAYARVLQNYLLVFSKNWYLVWSYYNKDKKLLNEMEELFDRYYDNYRALKSKTPLVPRICIGLFRINKILFCIVVCKLWFQCVSKMKYRIKSR